jgi:hypothetical protein
MEYSRSPIYNQDQPYSGIADAFSEVCRRSKDIHSIRKDSVDDHIVKIGVALVSELGYDVELLVGLIPELVDLLSLTRRKGEAVNDGRDFEAGQERWK